jgi:hypothetical protein
MSFNETLNYFLNLRETDLKILNVTDDSDTDPQQTIIPRPPRYNFDSFKNLFDFLLNTFGIITLPKNTMVFHSNRYLAEHLDHFEPIGKSMKIQDIRRYGTAPKRNSRFTYPFSKMNSRIYTNFTPAGNMYVASNMSVCESVYITNEPIFLFQLPYIEGFGHLKQLFHLELSSIFKEYIEAKNKELNAIFCGFVLTTYVDSTHVYDSDATFIQEGRRLTYPEILLIDGFDKFIKINHYDLWNIDHSLKTIDNIRSVEESGKASRRGDYDIPRVDIRDQKKWISERSIIDTIGKFGDLPLKAYIYNDK